MSDDTLTIEVDGKSVEARKGQMLIEVTDAIGTYVPRFCYHNKLSVAANCRMCLVEVEKAPKPLPACATPVMDGMKVFTQSNYAREAQKSVMEFLLINHPLDCPICDQGGECELQDLAMGYGNDVSRYQEKKRVVKDKNIGPLVQTEMTRCIHCTRCVRFGEEIAGIQELGSCGRGENMEIGTYVEKSMSSEMSGNIIDLCPVGALTSKPFRFSARTWEMKQLPGIAAHDAVGSNLDFHVRRNEVKRVAPAENEDINEVWLSDRDRFSYEGLYSEERLTQPMLKTDGEWQEVDWETALYAARDRLKSAIDNKGAAQTGTLLSANSSTEEIYLLQKLLRESACQNIDHRLGQIDFSEQDRAPVFPGLGQSIADLENLDAALIIGGNLRKEQPILNHRLRKASLNGAAVMQLNSVAYEFNYALDKEIIVSSLDLARNLAGVLKVIGEAADFSTELKDFLANVELNEDHRHVAARLKEADSASILLGTLCESYEDYYTIYALAELLAEHTGACLSAAGSSANAAGAWLAGGVPHRGPGGAEIADSGKHAAEMINEGLACYLLYQTEPELDCRDSTAALKALNAAESVIVCSSFQSQSMLEYADVLLPIALFAENEGSYVNAEGKQQNFKPAVTPAGEARPGWKVLRVLANMLGLDGFQYENIDQLRAEALTTIGDIKKGKSMVPLLSAPLNQTNVGIQRISDTPMNSSDSLVRHAKSLQETTDVGDGAVHINSKLAEQLGLLESEKVRAEQNENSLTLPLVLDDKVADGCALIHARQTETAALGAWFSDIKLGKT
ncbi:MAG: NADH-quinone oxidoreductase subunit G [Gammaproteobacteria bacterium]|nr:NADH-quinone oxidoreductase subunit G [Gammaproteobacteria bacterium]